MQLIEGFLERFKQHKQLTAEQPATTVESYLESLSPHDREHVQYLLGIVSVYNRNLSGDHPFTVIAEGSTLRTDYRIPQDVDLRLLCAVNPSHPKRGHAIRGMNNVLETLLNSEAIKFDIDFLFLQMKKMKDNLTSFISNPDFPYMLRHKMQIHALHKIICRRETRYTNRFL